MLASDGNDNEREIDLPFVANEEPRANNFEEEKDGARDQYDQEKAEEIDTESILIKSFSNTHTYEKSSYHHVRLGATTPFGLHKQASMSVFANRSVS